MGTAVSLDLRGGGDHATAIRDLVDWFHDVDQRFSTYRPTSEVSRISDGLLDAREASADLREVLAACEVIEDRSDGAFDVRCTGRLDPSAFVKGWSVDRAGAILRSHGCTDWSVNAGGDVLVTSVPGAGRRWRIGVQHPFDRSAVAMVLDAEDLAVSTSARYDRGDHLLDPRSGLPATAAASTTVIGRELGTADALSTAAFVLGEDGPSWIAGIDGYECWTALTDGRVLATAGFPTTSHGVPIRSTRVDASMGAVG